MMLEDIGWCGALEDAFAEYRAEGYFPARISREDREQYRMLAATGEMSGKVSGRFVHHAQVNTEFPAVGDWVACRLLEGRDIAQIHAVLPRASSFVREVADRATEAQVVAANVDTVFIVSGLDGGRAFNVRRLERYLTLAWESGGSPIIVLNKMDVCDDVESFVVQAESVASGVPVYAVSALSGDGLDQLRKWMMKGKTCIFLGSSGVGKSALVNALSGGDSVATGEVREHDRRGRHTTTWREMVVLPEGGVIIDTPGMRELRLWAEEESLSESFADIEELKLQCKFSDCMHGGEPGCAVAAALAEGHLAADRYESYLKLQRELEVLAKRKEQKCRGNSKAGRKGISLLVRDFKKRGHK